MIERLIRENEFPALDIRQEVAEYQQTLAGKNGEFSNRRFLEHLLGAQRRARIKSDNQNL